jgi:hypothetical protein
VSPASREVVREQLGAELAVLGVQQPTDVREGQARLGRDLAEGEAVQRHRHALVGHDHDLAGVGLVGLEGELSGGDEEVAWLVALDVVEHGGGTGTTALDEGVELVAGDGREVGGVSGRGRVAGKREHG